MSQGKSQPKPTGNGRQSGFKALLALLVICGGFALSRSFTDGTKAQSETLRRSTSKGTVPSIPALDPYRNLDVQIGEKIQDKEIELTNEIVDGQRRTVQEGRDKEAVDEKARPVFLRSADP